MTVVAPAGYPRDQARYVTTRDGVRIAIDLWLPGDPRSGDRAPTLFRGTRYRRAHGFVDRALERDSNFAVAQRLNPRGYAYVISDARGTGASFGVWTRSWSDAEIEDDGEVSAWIARQPWSNGRVGTFGISCDANTAELTAMTGTLTVHRSRHLASWLDLPVIERGAGDGTRAVRRRRVVAQRRLRGSHEELRDV